MITRSESNVSLSSEPRIDVMRHSQTSQGSRLLTKPQQIQTNGQTKEIDSLIQNQRFLHMIHDRRVNLNTDGTINSRCCCCCLLSKVFSPQPTESASDVFEENDVTNLMHRHQRTIGLKRKRCKNLILSLINFFVVTFSIIAFIMEVKSTFVRKENTEFTLVSLNRTNEKDEFQVYAPTFLVYCILSSLVAVYPIYLVIARFIFKKDKASFIEHFCILTSEQPKSAKLFARAFFLLFMWNAFLNCFCRSLWMINPIDIVAIISVMPCVNYLFSWIILHKQFSSSRIIAFILAASGVILNIHTNKNDLIDKVLLTQAVVIFPLFSVLTKKMLPRPTIGQHCGCFSVLGLFNIIFTWPLFFSLSLLTNFEPLNFGNIPWDNLFLSCLSGVVFIMSYQMSRMLVFKLMRHLILAGIIPATYIINTINSKYSIEFRHNRLASICLILTAIFLTTISNKLYEKLNFLLASKIPRKDIFSHTASLNQGAMSSSCRNSTPLHTGQLPNSDSFIAKSRSRVGSILSTRLTSNDSNLNQR